MAKFLLVPIIGRRNHQYGWDFPSPMGGDKPHAARANRLLALFRTRANVYVRVRADAFVPVVDDKGKIVMDKDDLQKFKTNLTGKARDRCFGGLSQLRNNGKIVFVPHEFKQFDDQSGRSFAGIDADPFVKAAPGVEIDYTFLPGEDGEAGPIVKMQVEHAAQVLQDGGQYCCVLEEVDITGTEHSVAELADMIEAEESATKLKKKKLAALRAAGGKSKKADKADARAKAAAKKKAEKEASEGKLPPPAMG